MQTPESIRSDFDRIAQLSGEAWGHNEHYHGYLISQTPEQCQQAFEIGCGTGEFSRLLARRSERVLAIDLSPWMVSLARERSKLCPNIDFVTGDAMTYPLSDNQFDCIATLATIHHLPLAAALGKIRRALKPGGTFVCLDLYQRSTLTDLLLDGMAYPSSPLLRLVKTGRLLQSKELREAYAEHGRTDRYLTLPRIRQICEEVLPGALVRRHLFWRYSIVWKKECGPR